MGVAPGFFNREKAFCTGARRFIDGDDGLLHQVVFTDNTLDHAGHLVGAAARPGWNHEFYGFGGLPRHSGANAKAGNANRNGSGQRGAFNRMRHECSSGRMIYQL